MLAQLTARQRLLLVIALAGLSQAAAVAGLAFDLPRPWALSISLSSGLAAMGLLLFNAALLQRFMGEFSGHTRRLAEGDLSHDIVVANAGTDVVAMMSGLQELQRSLRQALGAMRGGADGVSLAAQEIAQGNADLSVRTEQTATNLQQAASSMTVSYTHLRRPTTRSSTPSSAARIRSRAARRPSAFRTSPSSRTRWRRCWTSCAAAN